MSVTINGIPVGTRSLEYTNKSGDVFTTIEFDVDTDILQEGENKVLISMPEGGKVSSVQLTNYYCKETKKATDAKVIQDKITEAMELISDKEICISETGTGVPQGYKWVKQVEYDSFINAIEDASILLKDVLLTEDEVNETLSTLQIAMEMWQENQKNPIIQIPGMDTISFEDGDSQHIDPNPSEPEEDLVYAEKPQIDMIICHIVKDENLDRRCDICDKEILAKAPVLTSGNNAQWEQGSTTELTFISDAAYDDFIKVLVNGKHLASEQYAINGDVITLSLTPGYLSTLELGKYALEIVSSNGVAEGLFIITEADGNESGNTSTPESPSTSDTSHVIAISLLVVGSLLTVLFCVRKVKKT